MRPFIAAILLAACPCFADAIYKGPSGYVRLSSKPCMTEVVLSAIKDEYRDRFRQGWMVNHAREYELCWIVDGDSVFVVLDDGQSGRIPIAKFKPEQGV